jgi:hypothetical protein
MNHYNNSSALPSVQEIQDNAFDIYIENVCNDKANSEVEKDLERFTIGMKTNKHFVSDTYHPDTASITVDLQGYRGLKLLDSCNLLLGKIVCIKQYLDVFGEAELESVNFLLKYFNCECIGNRLNTNLLDELIHYHGFVVATLVELIEGNPGKSIELPFAKEMCTFVLIVVNELNCNDMMKCSKQGAMKQQTLEVFCHYLNKLNRDEVGSILQSSLDHERVRCKFCNGDTDMFQVTLKEFDTFINKV